MNVPIVHEVSLQRQRLMGIAGTTSDPDELHRIAQALANLNWALAIYEADAIHVTAATANGSPATVIVDDGHAPATVVIGRTIDGVAWECTCTSQAAAYNAACCHKLAAKLISTAHTQQRERAARAQRKADLEAAQQAHTAAMSDRLAAERHLDHTQTVEAQMFACMHDLARVVWWDEHASSLIEGAVAA